MTEQFTAFDSMMQQMGIGTDESQRATLPGDSLEQYFIAPLGAAHLVTFMSERDIASYNENVSEAEGIHPYLNLPTSTGKSRLYWRANADGRAKAQEAFRALRESKEDIGPQSVFFAGIDINEAINLTEEGKAKWEYTDYVSEARVVTFRSKYYCEYPLIAWPMAVRAAAECFRKELGIADDVELEFDVSEISDLGATVTDDFYKKYFGDPDVKGGYKDSIYFARRAALWKALGEDDPMVHLPMTEAQGKGETTSPVLSRIFGFLLDPWPNKFWAKFARVDNPKVDQAYTIDNRRVRRHLPGILKLYKTEADAQADVEVYGEEEGPSGSQTRQIPVAWADQPDDFQKYLADAIESGKKEVASAPKPLQHKKLVAYVAGEMDITVDEAAEWVE